MSALLLIRKMALSAASKASRYVGALLLRALLMSAIDRLFSGRFHADAADVFIRCRYAPLRCYLRLLLMLLIRRHTVSRCHDALYAPRYSVMLLALR